MPVTEEAGKTVFSLPLYPEMTGNQVGYVIDTIVSADA